MIDTAQLLLQGDPESSAGGERKSAPKSEHSLQITIISIKRHIV